jgi:hypothetical protein
LLDRAAAPKGDAECNQFGDVVTELNLSANVPVCFGQRYIVVRHCSETM